MKNIYRANMHRILKNWIYILGCIIAIVVTFVFTANTIGMSERFEKMGCDGRMIFISLAMMAYFTIFVPLNTNAEYRDGTIRNKLIAGFSQKEIYLGILFSHITSLAIMEACYFIAGIVGGAKISVELLTKSFIMFLSIAAYISVLEMIAMRVKKTVLVAILAFLILYLTDNIVMIGNLLLVFVLKGNSFVIGRIIYNISTMGQWINMIGMADKRNNPGYGVLIIISLSIIIVTVLLGTLGINKRDIK
ncbi:hypothetical protein SAMN04487830_104137 [Pseudobutyrivibrio sp. OR37]|uniref:hypothetical protein n=1 Tax=Pseudobutyrivibrio sp. OR37 TaxID=1798186 RepID=UPI0008EED31E|nr:hypothetical protein [Pseudobutyrivibrio sp. OR37]SFH66976.1 hypothetical protein SAMN04487830_104137 [Pseudobutyrivibrio sp. OR37]